jgi:hypothetical protein
MADIKPPDLDRLFTDNPADTASSAQLGSLFKGIQQWLSREKFAEVDTLLGSVNVSVLPPETLIAMLRYSFARRSRLENWDGFLSKVHSELNRRRLDAKRLLQGLSKPDDPDSGR